MKSKTCLCSLVGISVIGLGLVVPIEDSESRAVPGSYIEDPGVTAAFC
jgi:hypothetical protein